LLKPEEVDQYTFEKAIADIEDGNINEEKHIPEWELPGSLKTISR
jgi:hypothetical protein